MFCHKCGKQMVAGAVFCSACGTALQVDAGVQDRNTSATGSTNVSAISGRAHGVQQKQAILVVVSGLLAMVGFMASFGTQHSVLIGTQSMTGSQFAEASPSRWARYIQEGAGMRVDWSEGPPLQIAYLIPVAGLVLLGLGYRHFTAATRNNARAIFSAGVLGALVLVGCWWGFLSFYGSDDATPGIGSFLCAFGFAAASWCGFSAGITISGSPQSAAAAGVPGDVPNEWCQDCGRGVSDNAVYCLACAAKRTRQGQGS